jgi:hypothetical protein
VSENLTSEKGFRCLSDAFEVTQSSSKKNSSMPDQSLKGCMKYGLFGEHGDAKKFRYKSLFAIFKRLLIGACKLYRRD